MNKKKTETNITLDKLESAYLETMKVIVSIVDRHEYETARHSFNVKELALILANKCGITDKSDLKNIEFGALMHDIGKIGVSDMIIKKPGPLDDNERTIMKTHAQIGYDIVKTIPLLQEAAEMVYAHHERYDGTGYPRGLRGNEICTGARLLAVVDTFDALRSDRPYRKAVSLAETVLEINKNSGTQFDPDIVKIFNSCSSELNKIYKKF